MRRIDNMRSFLEGRGSITYVGLLLLAFASVGLITGCDTQEFLNNQRPPSDLGPGNGNWQEPANLDDVLSGGYWYMSGTCCHQSPIGDGEQMRTLTSDVAVPYNDAGNGNNGIDRGQAPEVYGRNSTNPSLSVINGLWTSTYTVIGNANEVISFVEDEFRQGSQPFPDPDNQMSRIYGEALLMRAWAYWNLATVYAPPYSQNTLQDESVVIRTRPVKDVEDSNKGPGTVEDLYNLMEADLQQAIEELPEQPRSVDPDFYNFSRFTKSAAEFMLARVSLAMQKWGQAQEMATRVIDDPKFNLSEDPIEAFNKNTYTRPSEVIYYYAYVEGNGVNNSPWKDIKTFNAWTFSPPPQPNVFMAASYSFLRNAGWMDSDNNETTLAGNDLRYQQLFERCEANVQCGSFTFDRATVWNNKYFRSPTNKGTNIPLFRLPEMYLTRAITSFTGNNGATQNQSQALSDVNAVRNHAGLSDLSSLNVQNIHRERMREMAFEGDRLWYLQANRVDVPNGDTNAGLGDFIIDGGREPGGSVAWDSDAFVWPIPEAERESNTAID